MRRFLPLFFVAALVVFAGCRSLQIDRPVRPTEADWPTEGDSPARGHAYEGQLAPPLEEVWTYNAGAGFSAVSPIILGDLVYVATRKGEVHAVDLERGKSQGLERFGDSIEGTPAVDGQRLYVPVGWGRSALYAYDLLRGETRWRWKGAPVMAGLLLTGDVVVAADMEGVVRAYDREDGAIRWDAALGERSSVTAAPVQIVGGPVVVADHEGRVAAFFASDGAPVWTRRLPAPVYTTPAASAAAVYVPTTRGRLVALDAATGAERWRLALPDTTVRFAAPALAGDLLVVAGTDGVLRGLDASTGAERWTFATDAAFAAAPLVAGDVVYAGSLGRMLFAVDRADGTLLWEQELKGRVKSAMAAHDGALVVLAEPRLVYLFKPTGSTYAESR